MRVFDLFSKRQKRARGEFPDVYVYDGLPDQLRVQIIHIIRDAFGIDTSYYSTHAADAYEFIHNVLCREYGVFELVEHSNSHQEAIFNFFLRQKPIERALDVIEICFRFIDFHISQNGSYLQNTPRKIDPDDAVAELNERFREHGIGYQFESGYLIRVDSEFLHAEVVKPTLAALRNKDFNGANEEFLKAHEHYRHGRYKECLVECLKTFESTMKTICKHRNWSTQPRDTAKNLIATCISNGLLPSYLESQFTSIRSLLESGVPTIRNRSGGHGQGVEPIVVPEYMARYALNLTATTILFLVEAYQTTK